MGDVSLSMAPRGTPSATQCGCGMQRAVTAVSSTLVVRLWGRGLSTCGLWRAPAAGSSVPAGESDGAGQAHSRSVEHRRSTGRPTRTRYTTSASLLNLHCDRGLRCAVASRGLQLVSSRRERLIGRRIERHLEESNAVGG